jgi:hypothetical protein
MGVYAAEDFRSQFTQGKDFFSEASGCHGARHSPDHAGGFILGKDAAPSISDHLGAFEAVLPHPREYHGEGSSAVHFGH